ncbi:hypothetical protein FC41_GL001673 [Lactobacillus hominis DSM 23910 = CRBIP 24.179]|nr:hypothetical protein FC41_GL001673 [Lactobacillus hominis DSM 23910 = CRBIP 24.179]MCT3348014.1 hypothetical protein [Lactobacillus hominis]
MGMNLMDEHYKKWIRDRKINYRATWIAFIVILALVPALIYNLGIFITFVELGGLAYFILDISQILKESHAFPKWFAIGYWIVTALYFVASFVSVFFNVWYLAQALGIIASAYFGLKVYYVESKGIRNKPIKLGSSTLALFIGLVVAAGLLIFNQLYFWIWVIGFAVVYDIFYWSVRIYIQIKGTNREF